MAHTCARIARCIHKGNSDSSLRIQSISSPFNSHREIGRLTAANFYIWISVWKVALAYSFHTCQSSSLLLLAPNCYSILILCACLGKFYFYPGILFVFMFFFWIRLKRTTKSKLELNVKFDVNIVKRETLLYERLRG